MTGSLVGCGASSSSSAKPPRMFQLAEVAPEPS